MRTFTFFAFFQPAAGITDLEALVVVSGLGAHADLFDLDFLLRLLGLFFFLCPLVNKLAVIDDTANRRLGVWSHFYQIEISLIGFCHGFFYRYDTDIFTAGINQADFFGSDTFIDSII